MSLLERNLIAGDISVVKDILRKIHLTNNNHVVECIETFMIVFLIITTPTPNINLTDIPNKYANLELLFDDHTNHFPVWESNSKLYVKERRNDHRNYFSTQI